MRRNVLIAALVVSLTANLVSVGFIAGRLGTGHAMLGGHPDPTAGFARLLREFDPGRREQLKPLLRTHLEPLHPRLRALRENHDAISRALTTEPFDPAALDAALAVTREQMLQTQMASHLALAALASELNAEEREQLAARMQRRGGHRRPGHGGPPPHDSP